MRGCHLGAVLAGALACMAAPGAKAQGFDPDEPCGPMLRRASDTDKIMVAAWALGYRHGGGLEAGAVDYGAVNAILQGVFEDCIADESLTMIALAQRYGAAGGSGSGSGSAAEAEQLLRAFLAPDANLAALTAALVPSGDDIAAVYNEPLAGKLTEMYAQMFTPGVQIGPKPEQDELLITYATTAQLKGGGPAAEEFPGGYMQVREFFRGDQPIVRFKFVEAGEQLGLAFDGLIFVNGHWVLMPKPWRALE